MFKHFIRQPDRHCSTRHAITSKPSPWIVAIPIITFTLPLLSFTLPFFGSFALHFFNRGANGGAGGDVYLQDTDGFTQVNGNVLTDGGNRNNAVLAAGRAGNITVISASTPNLLGFVQARGGNNGLAGAGGAGGTVDIHTLNNVPNGYYTGHALVQRMIDVRGGNSGTGTGGAGGTVTINTGIFQIGSSGGISIAANGGTGATAGGAGSITINTYGAQPVPSALDFQSTTASQNALPGGLFSVGNATVNGALGSITNGINSATNANASRIVEGAGFNAGNVRINAFGSSKTVNINGTATVINSDNGAGVRTQVTPALAMALYQVSRDSAPTAQTIGLNASRQLTGSNPNSPGSPSVITVAGPDMFQTAPNYSTLTAFNLQTAAGDGRIIMNITGKIPYLTIDTPTPAIIAGQLNFQTDAGLQFYFFPNAAPTITSTGSFTGGPNSTIVLVGSGAAGLNLINNGLIQAGNLNVGNTAGGFTIDQTGGGRIIGNISMRQLPNQSYTITGGTVGGSIAGGSAGNGLGTITINSNFQPGTTLRDLYSAANINLTGTGAALSTAAGSTVDAQNVTLNLSTPGFTNNATLSATNDITFNGPVGQALNIGGTGNITAARLIANSAQSVTISQGSLNARLAGTATSGYSISTSNGLSLSPDSAITVSAGSLSLSGQTVTIGDQSVLTASSNISVSGRNGINIGSAGGTGVTLNAGRMAAAFGAVPVILPSGSILENGAITIDNYLGGTGTGNIAIGDNVTMTARGGGTIGGVTAPGSITLQSSGAGMIDAGNNLSLTAWGGDIWLSGGDDVSIGTNARFRSMAKLDDAGANLLLASGAQVPLHTGGRIGIFAGLPTLSGPTTLSDAMNTRNGYNTTIVPAGFDQVTNSLSLLGSGILTVSLPLAASNKSLITANNIVANGGVILIDPPLPGNGVGFTAGDFLALAPALSALPPVPAAASSTTPSAVSPTTPPSTAPLAATTGAGISLELPSRTQQPVPKDVSFFWGFNTTVGSKQQEPVTELPADTGDTQLVVTTVCQPFCLARPDYTLVVGQKGTTFSTDNGIKLEQGKLLLATNKQDVTVKTSKGEVVVCRDSACIVEQKSHTVRIANVAGGTTTINLGSSKQSLNAGEELLIADGDTADEELIPVDGVERELVVEASITVAYAPKPQQKMIKNRFDVKKMRQFELVLNCTSVPTIQKKMEKLKEASNLSPVAYVEHLRQSSPTTAHTMEDETFHARMSADTHATRDAEAGLRLHHGALLLVAKQALSGKAGDASYELKPGAIAVISHDAGVTKVATLWEDSADGVRLSIGQRSITVPVGHEFVVAPPHSDSTSVLRGDSTGRRALSTTQVAGKTIITSQISLPSVILSNQLVHSLFRDDAAIEDKRTANKLMKMSTILTIVTAKHGAYSTFEK